MRKRFVAMMLSVVLGCGVFYMGCGTPVQSAEQEHIKELYAQIDADYEAGLYEEALDVLNELEEDEYCRQYKAYVYYELSIVRLNEQDTNSALSYAKLAREYNSDEELEDDITYVQNFAYTWIIFLCYVNEEYEEVLKNKWLVNTDLLPTEDAAVFEELVAESREKVNERNGSGSLPEATGSGSLPAASGSDGHHYYGSGGATTATFPLGGSSGSGGYGSSGSSGSGSSSSSSSSHSGSGSGYQSSKPSKHDYTDPYDVYDYDDPDDFADEWAEEFDGDDYDDQYEEAWDYWDESWDD